MAPAAGGLLDLVQPEKNGLLFAPGSAEGLAECVRTLQQQPRLHRRMAELARCSVEGRTRQAVGQELIQHYRDVIAEAGAPHDRAAA